MCVCVCIPCYIGVYQCGLWSVVQRCLCGECSLCETYVVCVCVCVCSGCMPCYIGVYQCGLWSVVQGCLCEKWSLYDTERSINVRLVSDEEGDDKIIKFLSFLTLIIQRASK